MISTKLKFALITGAIVAILALFSLWRITSIKLSNTREQLTETTCKLDELTKENARLVEYNKRRESQIKDLEKEYQKYLSSIPADLCGDMKPSKELIEFFKQGR